MFSFENVLDIERISNVSVFLGDTNTHGIMTRPWHVVSEGQLLLDGFIMESTILVGIR
jgi:hypothetical protein